MEGFNSPWQLSLASLATIFVELSIIYWIVYVTYNICFHPLANIPGPFIWRATRLAYVRSFLAGTIVTDVRKLHETYGDVVRVAPDEVSFARGDVWVDAFGRNPLPRNATFFKTPPGQPDNLVMTSDISANARMRHLISPAFTERSLTRQEPTIHSYADLLIDGLSKRIRFAGPATNEAVINTVDWFNWFAFDLVGELAFGESFESLRDTRHHPWVMVIFGSIKVMAFAAMTRYYYGVESFLQCLIPPGIRRMQREHYAIAHDKITRRMAANDDKDDFVRPLLRGNPNFEKMSLPEVESTMAIMIIAGSETTATALCGITHCLVQNPDQLRRLEAEIRGHFGKEDEVTIRAVQNLPFLNAVILEGLRMCHPVAGGLLRRVPKAGATICGYYLPGHTHVLISTAAMSLSETKFHRASEFIPDRFFSDDTRPAEFDGDQRNSQKPFGVGPRSCIGKSFALAELRIALARLIWRFDISKPPGKQVNWNRLRTLVVVEKKDINITIREVRRETEK
ncbi:cytochrome P450 [Coniella lustricola]|uniref:Cytochrome P450 n=1 Tax=Coniella lustricola TaxID=2025994 RepID=A0A2T3AG64_9PEZI|nr:cytochrome P450 [Coniella lustricola]